MEEKYRKNHIVCKYCSFYIDGVCNIRYISKIVKSRLCKDNANCYYKQLQLKDKMIELIINSFKLHSMDCNNCDLKQCKECKEITYKSFKQQALAELEK